MAEIRNQKLSITPPDNGMVTVTVRYDASFSAAEHFLGLHGLGFRENIKLFGEDAGLRGDDDDLHITLSNQLIALPAGEGPVSVARSVSKKVARSELQEDPSFLFVKDADEIYARITVTPLGLPVGDNERTLTVVIPG
ncbi:MAG: hypothetical protein MUD01_20025 [Chloroflexaceae bacterium]|jgi:hypothetical protein|nr:hypothetical protein [Chloroflexaceae bacterium]